MPLPSTMTPIATQELSSNAASVSFSNIPQTYTDLVLVINVRGSSDTESDIGFRVNSDTASNYSQTRIYGQVSSVGSDRGSSATSINIGRQGGSVFAPNTIHIMNYANTTTNKTILARSSHATSGSSITLANVGLWRSTSAITGITLIQLGAQSYKTGSTFTLYGVKAA